MHYIDMPNTDMKLQPKMQVKPHEYKNQTYTQLTSQTNVNKDYNPVKTDRYNLFSTGG